jgi:hypothetical protein
VTSSSARQSWRGCSIGPGGARRLGWPTACARRSSRPRNDG